MKSKQALRGADEYGRLMNTDDAEIFIARTDIYGRALMVQDLATHADHYADDLAGMTAGDTRLVRGRAS